MHESLHPLRHIPNSLVFVALIHKVNVFYKKTEKRDNVFLRNKTIQNTD